MAVADGDHVGMARGYVATGEPGLRTVVWLIGVYFEPAGAERDSGGA